MAPAFSLRVPPFFTRVASARTVLFAGAGGGFDVYAALPLALALHAQGARVHFANLTFTYLGGTDAQLLAPHLARVTPQTRGEPRYCPERSLARWLESAGLEPCVYAFEKVGVAPLRAAYATLVERLQPDAVVLVDGGTDLLMTGDEAGLGTPEEDMTSLAAVAGLPLPVKLAACIGFGVDAYHGVCHAHFLENVAALEREGGFLGSFSVPRASAEGQSFLDAVARANLEHLQRPSIVNNSIAAAVRGQFGDQHFTPRTAGSELFINPLMAQYWTFELEAVAARVRYLDALEDTQSIFEVSQRIEAFRHGVQARPRRLIPH